MRAPSRLLSSFALASIISFAPGVLRADPILAPATSAKFDVGLGALAKGYQRQQDVFATLENGLSLDTDFQPSAVQLVKDFFAQSATDDFKKVSGKHPYEVITSYGEWGDEGNFAGISSVGVAARLITRRAEGAPAAEITSARNAAVRAARAWHVYGSIGGPGIVARGVRRVTPWAAGDPPFPGASTPLTLVPLAGSDGKPLPAPKEAVWRAPVAPGYDGWVWMDDTSKDQVSGYALAAAWLWDALHGDPEVPNDVTDNLATDMTAFGRQLMKVAPELDIDLCIRDADGRLTSFHDLNPRQIVPESVLPETIALRNGFNAALALGVMRAIYHVGGDPEIGKYYYEELVGARDLPATMATNAGFIFTGAATNYSNVNMLAIGLATLGRTETDPYVRSRLEEALEKQFWATGSDRDASHVKQAWFDVVYAAYGKSPAGEVRQRITENLAGFQTPPAFSRDRVNCDDAELKAGVCIAIDGVTKITLLPAPGHNGTPVAKDILPMNVRPDSDFLWRSDPHSPNGTGSSTMNPGGDWLAAYWAARANDLEDGKKNVSPNGRPALSYTLGGGTGGGSGSGGGGGAGAPKSSHAASPGCSACEAAGAGSTQEGSLATAAMALAAAMAVTRQRRAPRSHARRHAR